MSEFRYGQDKILGLYSWIRRNTTGCRVVADFGSGRCDKLNHVWQPAHKIAIEIYPGYLVNVPPYVKAVLGDFREWKRYLSEEEIDCAMMIDTLEHIPKEDGQLLLRGMQEKFNRIIIFTPDGYHPQFADPIDGGNEYNVHECGWVHSELESEGFAVEADPEFHGPKGGALFAVWEKPA
jgi:hypothetical protein